MSARPLTSTVNVTARVLCAVCAASLLISGAACERVQRLLPSAAEAPPALAPPTQAPPAPSPDAISSKLASADQLAAVLPKLKRGAPMTWGRQTSDVPGYLATRLVARDSERALLVLTVEDLIDQPERRARMRDLPRVFKRRPADVRAGDLMRVFVAERFDVALRAEDTSMRRRDALRGWADRLELAKLDKLAETLSPPPPPPPEDGAP